MAARQAFCNRLSLLVTAGLDRWSSKQNSAYRLTQKSFKDAGIYASFFIFKNVIKVKYPAYKCIRSKKPDRRRDTNVQGIIY